MYPSCDSPNLWMAQMGTRLLLLIIAFTTMAVAGDQPTAQELVRRAAASADFQKLGAFRLRAEFTLSRAPHVKGVYSLAADGEGHWRDELAYDAYGEIRVGAAGRYRWIRKGPDAFSPLAQRVRELIGFGGDLRERVGMKLSDKVAQRGKGSKRIACISRILGDAPSSQELCFDPENHLVSEAQWRHYSDFRLLGEFWFPALLEEKNADQDLTVKITLLERVNDLNKRVFQSNESWAEAYGCPQPQRAFPLRVVFPEYTLVVAVTARVGG